MRKLISKIGLVVAGVSLVTSNASAAMDLTGVTFNTADATAVGLLVLGAVAVIWGVRKAISMGSKG